MSHRVFIASREMSEPINVIAVGDAALVILDGSVQSASYAAVAADAASVDDSSAPATTNTLSLFTARLFHLVSTAVSLWVADLKETALDLAEDIRAIFSDLLRH
jgi:hypothetical protein